MPTLTESKGAAGWKLALRHRYKALSSASEQTGGRLPDNRGALRASFNQSKRGQTACGVRCSLHPVGRVQDVVNIMAFVWNQGRRIMTKQELETPALLVDLPYHRSERSFDICAGGRSNRNLGALLGRHNQSLRPDVRHPQRADRRSFPGGSMRLRSIILGG